MKCGHITDFGYPYLSRGLSVKVHWRIKYPYFSRGDAGIMDLDCEARFLHVR
jgi:hypothetical protein